MPHHDSEHPPPHKLIAGLQARRERHRQRHLLLRVLVVVNGLALLIGGLVMLVLPGPALVVIPLGLAMLALEFVWAERLLHVSLHHAEKARRKAAATTGRQRGVAAAGTAAAAGAALTAILVLGVNLPVVPVI